MSEIVVSGLEHRGACWKRCGFNWYTLWLLFMLMCILCAFGEIVLVCLKLVSHGSELTIGGGIVHSWARS